jgi:multiple sugar transport system substrate-binding protein
MRNKLFALVSLLVVLSTVMALAAQCPSGGPAPTAQIIVQTVPVEVTKVVQQTVLAPTTTPAKDRVQIYWYIGLGAGAQPGQIPPEKDFIDRYNKSQNEIQLIPIIVDTNYARDNLKAQIAAGNAPDIVGPVGKQGRGFFPGAFVDLTPLITEFKYDMGDVDPKFLDFYKDEGKLVGLPFAVFPSFLFINKKLFDEAKLPYPPQKFGDKYNGKDWDVNAMAELAMKLTVDKNGNDATSPNFDPKNIVQYGFEYQFTDARGYATLFGGGSLVDAQGNAQIPDYWRVAWKYFYDAMWVKHFMPTQAALDSDLLKPSAFASGKVAIVHCHLWAAAEWAVPKDSVPNWDIAVVPSYNGKYTAKLHGDTFAIMAASKHPKEAFKVLTYMLGAGAPDLYKIYGGMPARKSQQDAFFADLDKTFAPNKVNWQVAKDSMAYYDDPNHEAGLPNFAKANDAINKFGSDLRSTANLELDKRIDQLKTDLDKIYKEK